MTGPTKATVVVVWDRDKGRCAKCGRPLRFEDRGYGWSLSHRLPRGMGGTKNPWINLPGNLNLLCGSATTGCHGEIEGHRRDAEAEGFLVRRGITPPADIPIHHFLYGVVRLRDDGTIQPIGEYE